MSDPQLTCPHCGHSNVWAVPDDAGVFQCSNCSKSFEFGSQPSDPDLDRARRREVLMHALHRFWVAWVRFWLPARSARDSRKYALGPDRNEHGYPTRSRF
jgi:DNA-directed RNA polymerase subunit RPC12/RpoP